MNTQDLDVLYAAVEVLRKSRRWRLARRLEKIAEKTEAGEYTGVQYSDAITKPAEPSVTTHPQAGRMGT
jgi:hypothetical protein